MLASNNRAEPLDCLPKGTDSQLTSLWIGCDRIQERRRLGLDAGGPDIEPFSEMPNELIELRIPLKGGFEAMEYPTRGVSRDCGKDGILAYWTTSSDNVLNTIAPVSFP